MQIRITMVIRINVFKRINPLGFLILNLHQTSFFSFLSVYAVYKPYVQYRPKKSLVKYFFEKPDIINQQNPAQSETEPYI